jgi:hypothetical protein
VSTGLGVGAGRNGAERGGGLTWESGGGGGAHGRERLEAAPVDAEAVVGGLLPLKRASE